jgi:hypothetical protein
MSTSTAVGAEQAALVEVELAGAEGTRRVAAMGSGWRRWRRRSAAAAAVTSSERRSTARTGPAARASRRLGQVVVGAELEADDAVDRLAAVVSITTPMRGCASRSQRASDRPFSPAC